MRQVKTAQIPSIPPILGFSLVIFFITLADGIMSYITPIRLQNNLNDTALVGIIISVSSFFGIILDLYIAQNLPHKSFKYFLTKTFLFAAAFPLILIFAHKSIAIFCFSMIVWSIYYEFIGYSKYNFVQKYVHLRDHTNAWSMLVTFSSLAYMLGPGMAVFLIHKHTNLPLYTAFLLVAVSTLIYFLLSKSISKRKLERTVPVEQGKNLFRELGLLKLLMKKLWVLAFFTVSITLMDVLMWTVGVLYTEELSDRYSIGGWLMVVYGLPSLFVGLITEKIKLDIGKKRMAFTTAAVSGICLMFSGFRENIYTILAFVFFMSIFYGITVILIDATFQDYVSRANIVGNDIVSLLQFSHNIAYAFGPIILGFLAKYAGYGRTFQIVGGFVIVVSVISYLVTPRKIKLPQKELKLEAEESFGSIGSAGDGKLLE